jgi:hypothetical protein
MAQGIVTWNTPSNAQAFLNRACVLMPTVRSGPPSDRQTINYHRPSSAARLWRRPSPAESANHTGLPR